MLIPTQESPPKIGKHSREIFVRSLPHSISDAKYATAPIFFLSLALFFSSSSNFRRFFAPWEKAERQIGKRREDENSGIGEDRLRGA